MARHNREGQGVDQRGFAYRVGYQPDCAQSNRAELRVSRRVAPPPRSRIQAWCAALPAAEEQCDDGKDNDEDCLVDEEDPDCGG